MAQGHRTAEVSRNHSLVTRSTTSQSYEMPYLYTMQSTYNPNPHHQNETIFNDPWIPPDSFNAYLRTPSYGSGPYTRQNDVLTQDNGQAAMNCVKNTRTVDVPLYSPAISASEEQQFNMLVPQHLYRSNSIASSAQSSSSSVGEAVAELCFSSNGSQPNTPTVENQPHIDLQNPVSVEESASSNNTRPKRKRGRPRLIRVETSEQSNLESARSSNNRISKRLPHTQVERKYREGLNAELERLRQAIPTLPKWDPAGALTAPPKPSKATVLSAAIDYIHGIEAERKRLLEENSVLRSHVGRVDAVKKAPQQRQFEDYNVQIWSKPSQVRI